MRRLPQGFNNRALFAVLRRDARWLCGLDYRALFLMQEEKGRRACREGYEEAAHEVRGLWHIG